MAFLILFGSALVASAFQSLGAGERADSMSSPIRGFVAVSPDPPIHPQIRYWKHLAEKRLNGWHRMELARNYWKRKVERLRAESHRKHGQRANPSGKARSVRSIICSVFGAHCSEALRVAWCESRFNVYARNGMYWGLFQMGSFARARYGHSWNAWGQSRAAYRYFLDAGWSPWECSP